MHSGCVVFLSNISNHSELVEHGVDGYIYDLKKDNLKELFQKKLFPMRICSRIYLTMLI